MHLKEYLDQAKISMAEFARRSGIARSIVGHIVLGTRLPSLLIAVRIEQATKGKVRPKDLVNFYNTQEHSLKRKKR